MSGWCPRDGAAGGPLHGPIAGGAAGAVSRTATSVSTWDWTAARSERPRAQRQAARIVREADVRAATEERTIEPIGRMCVAVCDHLLASERAEEGAEGDVAGPVLIEVEAREAGHRRTGIEQWREHRAMWRVPLAHLRGQCGGDGDARHG